MDLSVKPQIIEVFHLKILNKNPQKITRNLQFSLEKGEKALYNTIEELYVGVGYTDADHNRKTKRCGTAAG